ncbi:MAG: hypothetical protein RR235_09015 [Oscillospiraceae bacterium]
MSNILAAIGSVFTAVIGMVGDVAGIFTATTKVGESTVLANPLLLVFLVVPLVGLGVGLFRRLLNVH